MQYNWGRTVAYVHFPFCRNICDFCGYETRLIDKPSVQSFGPNLVRQIDHIFSQSEGHKAKLDAIFFGGGTASLMPSAHLSQIIDKLLANSTGQGEIEITLECEPGTISKSTLREVKAAGVNRISVCSQSFDDDVLKGISRLHTAEDSYRLIDDCVSLGFENIHIDLMYGLQGQDMTSWENTLRTVTTLPAQHASTYKLYVYKHGQLHRSALSRRPEHELDPYTELCSEMSNLATSIFEDSGLFQYSLTEYARKGMECRYVTACFDGSDVMPIGPSSFGRCGREIWDNSPYAHLFGDDDFGREHDRAIVLSSNEVFKRDMLLGLWLLSVDIQALSNRHRVRPSKKFLALLQKLTADGWLTFDGTNVQVLKDQRFFVGFPMEELARLPGSEWCESLDAVSTPKAVEVSKLMQRRQELNFVVRMARRDPKFFFEVNKHPLETLERSGFQGELAEVEMLVRAISHVSAEELTEEELQLRVLWGLVEQEHLRGLKAQKIAGLA